jgi:hypothetical protein
MGSRRRSNTWRLYDLVTQTRKAYLNFEIQLQEEDEEEEKNYQNQQEA